MKYKKLSKEQLIISFDRLTRFKPTREKYFRVFCDIIISNLIEPVYKKSDLLLMPSDEITRLAEIIINSSLSDFADIIEQKNSNQINSIIKDYENSLFINNDEVQNYLNNNINFHMFVQLIDESCPINLRWIKAIYSLTSEKTVSNKDLIKLRHNLGIKFPIQKILLAEGITEEILLPVFSKYLGFDFYKEGIQIIAAGGKNQVVKMYYKLIEELKVPIFVLLDKDAEENINQITPKLRNIDKIHLVSCGEFEDLLPKSLIIKTLNNELTNFATVTADDFDTSLSSAENLENIFKTKGLHEFKKAEFAKLVKDNISDDDDISAEIASIVMELGL